MTLPMLAFAAALLASGCARPAGHIMTFEEYARLEHLTPCPLDFTASGGRLHYFGAAHSFDPADPQGADIERRWGQFRPDMAMNEGGDPPVAPGRDEAIARYGEPGLVRWLANRDGVPVRSLDPTHQDEIAHLRSRFSADELMVFYAARSIMQDNLRDAAHRAGPETTLDRTIGYYARFEGMNDAPRSGEAWLRCFHALAPAGSDWHDPPRAWFDPVPRQGLPVLFTNRMAREASEFRDRFMVDLLVREVHAGRRVFAVVGASHVIMQEPALRARLGWHP